MEKKQPSPEEMIEELLDMQESYNVRYYLDREHHEQRREEILKQYLASALEYVEPSNEADQNNT